MSERDYKTLLQFSDRWFRLGLLAESDLRALGQRYETSGDKNTEHYRYQVFRDYLASHRPLSPSMAEALYELGQVDSDTAMGGAMMREIVELSECPANVEEQALASGEKYLVKVVKRKRMLAELNAEPTAEVIARCLTSQDADIQRELLARAKLSRNQLNQLVETGANRAIRNLATVHLRSKREAV